MHAKNLVLTFALVIVPVASFAGASLVACSSSTTTSGSPAPGVDAGTADDAGGTDAATTPPRDAAADASSEASSDGSAACNSVTQAATEASTSTLTSAAPTATGGTILPGTYFLKEIDIYDPAGTASASMPSGLTVTLVITGNVMDSVQDLPDGSSQTFSETFTTDPTTKALNRVLTCPKPGPDLAAKYTVTGTGITIYETDPMSMNVAGSIYEKQ